MTDEPQAVALGWNNASVFAPNAYVVDGAKPETGYGAVFASTCAGPI